jgi:hypothetical protein
MAIRMPAARQEKDHQHYGENSLAHTIHYHREVNDSIVVWTEPSKSALPEL